tara:strand:- start:1821 stop:2093 length:273 start_codon:yes stop_codon:yes gene_type:complete
MTDNFRIVSPEAFNTINDGSTYTFAEAHKITEFQLKLGDGSTVTVPCTEIAHLEGTTVLAAAIHHLIRRVEVLEAIHDMGTMQPHTRTAR